MLFLIKQVAQQNLYYNTTLFYFVENDLINSLIKIVENILMCSWRVLVDLKNTPEQDI